MLFFPAGMLLTRQRVPRCSTNIVGARGARTATFMSDEAFGSHIGHRGHVMSIVGWLVLGLIAGFIASKIVNHTGSGVVVDIALGIVGAIVGGWIFHAVGHVGVDGFNIYSMCVATIGAIVVLVVYHALVGRRAIT